MRSGTPPSSVLEIRYENALISAEIENAPLGRIFERLAQATALEAHVGNPAITRWPVSTVVEGSPLQEGLKQILKGFSYALYSADGRLVVHVLSTRPQATNTGGKSPRIGSEPSLQTTGDAVPGIHADQPVPGEGTGAAAPQSLDEFQPLSTPEATAAVGSEEGDGTRDVDQAAQEQGGDEARLQRALSALASEHKHLHVEALDELASIADARAIEALAQAARAATNLDPGVRVQAVTALSQHALNTGFDDPVPVDALKQLAQDQDENVRAIARQTFEEIRKRE
jgi:hypothetical protein